jgi:carbon-monoxide dehydrogenase medium subunit
MKPAPFKYYRPGSLDEAVSLLERYEGDAKPLSGGQSLIPLMNMRLARPSALIDLAAIPGLDGIELGEQRVRIGAMTRHRALETSTRIARALPILPEAVRYIGHRAIRSRGTIGGSIAHADPAAELPAIAALLNGEFVLRGSGGARTITWDEFFQGYLMTAIEPSEILTEVSLEVPARAGWSFMEIARRHGDFAIAGVAVLVKPGESGRLADVRIALFGVAPAPVRARTAEEALAGTLPDRDAFASAAQLVRDNLSPDGDVHGSADYRRHLAGVLTERALEEAANRAFAVPGELISR